MQEPDIASSSGLPAEFARGTVLSVHQGDCLVSGGSNTIFATVLGSCISACVRDRVALVGGMNHFLLAAPPGIAGAGEAASARYGAFAMEHLIETVLSRGTGLRENLEIKVFGGGSINAALADIGAQNIRFVRDFLAAGGFGLEGSDLGGAYARRVLFRPASGRAFVRRLGEAAGRSVLRREMALAGRPDPVL